MAKVSLDDMMDGAPRTAPEVPDAVAETATPKKKSTPKKKATVVQNTAPVDLSKAVPIDVHEILPKAEPEPSQLEQTLMGDLNIAVEREKRSISKRIDDVIEMQEKEREEAQLKALDATVDNNTTTKSAVATAEDEYGIGDLYSDDDDEYYTEPEPVNAKHISTTINIPADNKSEPESVEVEEEEPESVESDPVLTIHKEETPSIIAGLDNDALYGDDDDEDSVKIDQDEQIKIITDAAKEKVAKIRKQEKFDLSKFTITSKPINLNKVMKMAVLPNQNVADWVMYDTGRPVSVTGLSGAEIVRLDPSQSNRNRLNTFRDIYRIIYDHIESNTKPEFESWMKMTRFSDVTHIYFALYMATFGKSNFTNYSCPKCNNVFIQDIDIDDMITYKNDEVKAKVKQILALDSSYDKKASTIENTMVQAGNYVFAIHTPTIWNVIIETASLNENFLNQYSDSVDIISYIESIYLIDEKNMALIPIDTKPVANNVATTAGRKFKVFYDVLKTLSSEDFYYLRSQIVALDQTADDISYKLPKCTCPKCKAEIPEQTMSPDTMLFTRHQLAALGNT